MERGTVKWNLWKGGPWKGNLWKEGPWKDNRAANGWNAADEPAPPGKTGSLTGKMNEESVSKQ